MIEPREMVHVGVTHEHVADPKQHAGGKRADVTYVEKNGATLELEVDAQARVTPYTVDQPGVEDWFRHEPPADPLLR
jgi:hypothetical protein